MRNIPHQSSNQIVFFTCVCCTFLILSQALNITCPKYTLEAWTAFRCREYRAYSAKLSTETLYTSYTQPIESKLYSIPYLRVITTWGMTCNSSLLSKLIQNIFWERSVNANHDRNNWIDVTFLWHCVPHVEYLFNSVSWNAQQAVLLCP